MRYVFLFSLLWCAQFSMNAHAQAPGTRSYQSLELPLSAHSAALGGENISIIADDLPLALHNPALLSSVSDKTFSLGYMNYMADIQALHAGYSQVMGARSTLGGAMTLMDYGMFSRRDDQDQDLGTFTAKDINFMLLYAYNLTDYWSGGVAAKAIYRRYDVFSSLALATDLALNYYNAEQDFSFSIAARNLGGEVQHFEDQTEKLPVNFMIGATKKLAHAPFAMSATMSRLQDWDEGFVRHLSLGVDAYLSKAIYAAIGYNFRRASELKVGDSAHGAGWTFGAGLHTKRIKADAAYGRYHVAGSSILLNFAYSF